MIGRPMAMLGTVPTGTTVRRGRYTTPMVVAGHWQDEVTVRSTKSGRLYRWQDTEYVYVEASR